MGLTKIEYGSLASSKILNDNFNFLETEKTIFLPMFGVDTDNGAINKAKSVFNKKIIPVNINEIAEYGGLLNCISWGN